MSDKRYFNISMQSITIESKDHFKAALEFFNLHSGIGLLMIQEMDGPDKIGDPVNIRNTFDTHDKLILDKLDAIIGLNETGTSNKVMDEYLKDLKKEITDAEIGDSTF